MSVCVLLCSSVERGYRVNEMGIRESKRGRKIDGQAHRDLFYFNVPYGVIGYITAYLSLNAAVSWIWLKSDQCTSGIRLPGKEYDYMDWAVRSRVSNEATHTRDTYKGQSPSYRGLATYVGKA